MLKTAEYSQYLLYSVITVALAYSFYVGQPFFTK